MTNAAKGTKGFVSRPIKERINSGIEEDENGCWNWKGSLTKNGYGVIFYNGKNRRAHRVSYETFVSDIPAGIFVCHRCDNRRCINPSHLFLGTAKDNIQDCAKKGRMFAQVSPEKLCKGEDSPHSKLTEENVKFIRENGHLLKERDLADRFNVSSAVVHNAKIGNTWKHVETTPIRNPRIKLKDNDVIEIRKDTRTLVAIAKEYGVSHQTISEIKRGKTWTSI